MPIYAQARGYCYSAELSRVAPETFTKETCLFQDNVGLLLEHQAEILSHSAYFFCSLAFAHVSIGALGVTVLAGPLRTGHLLIGWRHGSFTDRCPQCPGRLLITSFGALLNTGRNWWRGFCVGCREWQRGSSSKEMLEQRRQFAARLLKRTPDRLEIWQPYIGTVFSWGGSGARPALRQRWSVRRLYHAVSLENLIEELETGIIRAADPPVIGLSQTEFERKFAERQHVQPGLTGSWE